MRLTYDPATDLLRIMLRPARITHSEVLEKGVTVDLDADGHVVGFRLDHAKDRLGAEDLTSVTYENLSVHQRNSLKLP